MGFNRLALLHCCKRTAIGKAWIWWDELETSDADEKKMVATEWEEVVVNEVLRSDHFSKYFEVRIDLTHW